MSFGEMSFEQVNFIIMIASHTHTHTYIYIYTDESLQKKCL